MRSLHRRLAWIAAIVALLWAFTGFLHPIMSWTAPRPATMAPPHASLALEGARAPGPLLAARGWGQARGLRLIEADGARFWLAFGDNGRTLALNAETGAPDANAERVYAIALARHYTGRADAAIASAQKLTRFSLFYPSINHILPVWDVRFSDGLAVYVDTRADRLVTMADPLRRALLFTFQNIHTLQFLSSVEPLRKTLIAILIGATLATAVFGLAMSFAAKGKNMRAWHRLVGLIAGPLLICFAGSGLFHLLTSRPAAMTEAALFSASELAPPRLIGAAQSISASAAPNSQALWRVALPSQTLYFDANGRVTAMSDGSRARQIAQADAASSAELLTHYSAEYGFAFKRLPVWRVASASGVRFADVEEGLIAADAPHSLEAIDAWSFNTIHKWRFLDPIGQVNRDLLMMLAVMGIAVVALMGLMLTPKPRMRRTKETHR